MFSGLERSAALKGDIVLLRCSDAMTDILEYCQRLLPCTLIVDESFLEGGDSLSFSELADFGRSVRILVRVSSDTAEIAERLLRMGCSGLLKITDTPATVVKAIKTVTADQLWVSRTTLSRIVRTLLFAEKCNLTAREVEILTYIGQGHKNQEIAERLFISPQTVRWHIRSLYTKIGVRDRPAAIEYARNYSVADPGPSSVSLQLLRSVR